MNVLLIWSTRRFFCTAGDCKQQIFTERLPEVAAPFGRHVIRESKLANGDTFLISLGNCTDASAAQLSMDRVAEVEKPLEGVGERGLVRVKKYPKKGSSEVGVTALQGNFTLSLTHSSTEGKSHPGPLTELLRKALTRL